jgi:phosphoglycerol transferase MdoB-like AlkP superfamily enzyme
MAPIFLFKKNLRAIAFIILDFVVSLLFMIDIWYLRGFNVFPTLYAFQAIGNMSGD